MIKHDKIFYFASVMCRWSRFPWTRGTRSGNPETHRESYSEMKFSGDHSQP
jgi:hypothetical protein